MLSVVMSNFNHARFLPQALDALIAQSRPADEIIIIDDSSTDESVQVIETYLPLHPFIRLVNNVERLGVLANMNQGIQLAQQALIFFAAADDVTYPRLFERGTELLQKFPQAALFSARTDIIDACGRSQGALAAPIPRNSAGFITQTEANRFLMDDDGWFSGTTTIWRRNKLIAAGGFRLELGAFADGYLSRCLTLKHGACYSPEVLAAWRRIEGGMAWSAAANFDQAEKFADAVQLQMARDKVFPPGYAKRWKGRHLFGTRRFLLIQARRKAKATGWVHFLWAWTREVVLATLLFFILRRADFRAVLSRRWKAIFKKGI
jgi:glycosyltransferase involved in cell wall biosynthesis